LATLLFAFWGLGIYSAGDVLNYAFLASRLQSDGLQTKLRRHTGIVSPRSIFDDALSVFNTSMGTDLLSNPSEIAALKLMKKMADIYFTRVTKNVESTFSLSPQQMALWTSQREDHTSDWVRTVPIFGVFAGDIYGNHAISCTGIIGIKHRHNVVRDTLVDICYRYGISAGKEVDIGLDGGRDKPLRPTDMLLYSRDGGCDVCVDLTGSLPLIQTVMADFLPGRAVINVAQRKRGNYMDKCGAMGYGFLPFSFSSVGELEADAISLLKRIRKFFMTQDIGARAVVHIFNRFSFAIAKGVGTQIPCSAYLRLFSEDIYGDHAVSCAGIIGIKHRHNLVRDTLVDICYRSGILAGNEVDIGLDGARDKPLRPLDMVLYSWDGGLDVCVDLTGSSPLTQTGMVDFVPGRAVIDAAECKHFLMAYAEYAFVGIICIVFPRPNFDECLSVLILFTGKLTLLSNPKVEIAASTMGLSAVKEVDIGVCLRVGVSDPIPLSAPTDMLLYSSGWWMIFFCIPISIVRINAGNYNGYSVELIGIWVSPFSFSSVGELAEQMQYLLISTFAKGVGTPDSIPLFSVLKPCSAYLRLFSEDIYGDHAVSCAGIIGIKHRHNLVHDILLSVICYSFWNFSGNEVDIGLGWSALDKPLRPLDMVLYSWDGGLDVCVDLTGSSPL
ncbi:hypothetical protein Tco_0340371, partial [Tanacetum coccineum]